MKKFTCSMVLLIIFITGLSLAQNKYERALRDYSFRGLKVGMTMAQVDAKYKMASHHDYLEDHSECTIKMDDATIVLLSYRTSGYPKSKVESMSITFTETYIYEQGGAIKFVADLGLKFGDPTTVEEGRVMWKRDAVHREAEYSINYRDLTIN